MNGILLIDKVEGWTSFDVVAKVRGIVRQVTGVKRSKVGHAGTLDPLATGLLVILVGDYCRRADEFSKREKTYTVELCLGKTSTTDDREGDIVEVSGKEPTQEEVATVVTSFIGDTQQVPPIFSAIKVGGKRAYALARAGKQPAMKPRTVTIHSITDVTYQYPKVSFTTEVSSGTYIRSLARDIGERLATGAYMSALKRTVVGDFDIDAAHKIDALTPETIEQQLVRIQK